MTHWFDTLRPDDMATIEAIQTTALARLFSATVIKELANQGYSSTFSRLLRESGLSIDKSSSAEMANLFDRAFSILAKRENRHEYIYKAVLTHKLLLGVHSLQTASMATEFRVGDSKADLVIFNGTGTVYEIKSERDSLKRLSKQLDAYSKVFATVNVIVGENHLAKVKETVPNYVGISVLTGRNQVSTVRNGVNDPQRTQPDAIFNAISQREASLILGWAGLEPPQVPNTMRFGTLQKLFVTLKPEVAHMGMVKWLKITRELQSLQGLLDEVPKSLYTATLTARLSKRQKSKLVEALRTPVNEAIRWG